MAQNKSDIILNGNLENYRFNPWKKKSVFQKSSKFSHVFLGESQTGNPVIIKVLPSQLAGKSYNIERFKAEIQWNGMHPNIEAPFEYLFQDQKHYLIGEFVKGIDLNQYRRQVLMFHKNRIKLALECGIQLLEALEKVHSMGFVHSDIKPANVMLLGRSRFWVAYTDPKFKLIDFGTAHRAFTNPVDSGLEQWPFVLVYSAPEQVFGFWELIGYQSDLYSVAILLYEMITKEPLYDSNLSVKIMNLQTSFPLQPHKDIPSPLMEILSKATTKHHFKKPPNHYKRAEIFELMQHCIARRYQSATDFKKALANYLILFNNEHTKRTSS